MTKEQAINKIQKTQYVYLNNDQKKIAIGIINSIPKGQDVLAYFDFIMKRADVGFKFDVAPEIATGRIAVVNEMKEHNINTDLKTVDIDENKLIIGDNYEALKNLLLTHKEKIDVIYIDPPYNTEKSKEDGNTSSKEGSSSKFIYKDKFGRNGWLNMMRDRLVLAKRLLSPEGAIFVSIDDAEQAYLKVLMDDIFGEDNFVGSMPRMIKKGGLSVDSIVSNHEYTLVYKTPGSIFGKDNVDSDKFTLSDEFVEDRGKYYLRQLDISGRYTASLDFPVEFGGEIFYPHEEKKISSRTKRWRYSKEMFEFAIKEQSIISKNKKLYKKEYFSAKISKDTNGYKWNFVDRTQSKNSLLFVNEEYMNSKGTLDVKNLGINNFDFPKPVVFLKEILLLLENKNAIVLDFFAGSGTTGHAVMELNNEDKGNRKFILVTNNENNIGLDVTYERIYRVINGKTSEDSKDFKWLEKNAPFKNEKLRVFNIKHFDVETDQSDELENITNMAIENLKKINPLYDRKDSLQVYYDLDGLNPINEAQKEQIYSTDFIKHRISNNVKDSNKNYCTCGKSFIKIEDFDKHMEENNDK